MILLGWSTSTLSAGVPKTVESKVQVCIQVVFLDVWSQGAEVCSVGSRARREEELLRRCLMNLATAVSNGLLDPMGTSEKPGRLPKIFWCFAKPLPASNPHPRTPPKISYDLVFFVKNVWLVFC